MQTLIREIENRIREREDNLRYSKEEHQRHAVRIKEDEETLSALKKELAELKIK